VDPAFSRAVTRVSPYGSDEGRSLDLEVPVFQGCSEERIEPAHIAG
jgi:hypothetical protein